jgi:cell division protein ZapD
MQNHITYELPINERMRTLLRLELLFGRAEHHLQGTTLWDTRAFVSGLIEILSIGGRADLKSELLKEIDRQINSLSRLSDQPDIDTDRLNSIIQDLQSISQTLYQHSGQVGASLKNHEFIKSIMQRTSIPGGTCDFDLPAYHYWLQQDSEARSETLRDWYAKFDIVKQASQLILTLIRESAEAQQHVAEKGFYQETMEATQPAQIIRVSIDRQYPVYAEISGGKHRFAIRFLEMSLDSRSTQITEDIPFTLTRCML